MYEKILVPFDGSEPSKHALQNALQLTNGIEGARITVLKVVEWRDHNAETFKIASRMSAFSVLQKANKPVLVVK